MDIILRPIGKVHSSEHISDQGSREDYWGDTVSEIRLDEKSFTPDALEGLSEFSHVEVLFHLHSVREDAVVSGLRHPRSNPDWPPSGNLRPTRKGPP